MNLLAKKEIFEIPGAIARAQEGAVPRRMVQTHKKRPFAYGVWLARGSSKNAAMWMSKILWKRAGFGLFHLPFSEAAFRGFRGDLKRALCVAISQSGSTREVLNGVKDCHRLGGKTFGLANVPDSPLGRLCDYAALIGAGEEEGFATKSFVATLIQAWKLAEAMDGTRSGDLHEARLPKMTQAILDDNPLAGLTRHLKNAKTVIVLGRGLLSPIACEVATKLKECCVKPSWAMSGEEFLHGAAGLARAKDTAVIFLIDKDENLASELKTARYLAARRANYVLIGPHGIDLKYWSKKRILTFPGRIRGDAMGVAVITAFYRALLDLSAASGFDLDNESFIRSVSPASYRRQIPSLA